jgi:CRISPR system Cascade subunit CasB
MMNKEMQKIFADWWTRLQDNHGGRAQLRRCRSPEEVALHPETHRLKNKLPGWLPLEAVATIVGVSAHIKNSTKQKFAQSLATPKEKNGRVPLSENRFRQLISCREWGELYRGLRRSVTLLDGRVNLLSFVDTILLWNDEFRGAYKKPGKGVKFELSRDYYETAIKHEK